MKWLIISLLLSATASNVLAVHPGQTIIYDGGDAGPVAFSGRQHRQTCSQCHNPQAFPRMQQGAVPITMADIDAGLLCGLCHNGREAFASRDHCQRCHQPPRDQP